MSGFVDPLGGGFVDPLGVLQADNSVDSTADDRPAKKPAFVLPPLSFEQETYLKKLLLRHVVSAELNAQARAPGPAAAAVFSTSAKNASAGADNQSGNAPESPIGKELLLTRWFVHCVLLQLPAFQVRGGEGSGGDDSGPAVQSPPAGRDTEATEEVRTRAREGLRRLMLVIPALQVLNRRAAVPLSGVERFPKASAKAMARSGPLVDFLDIRIQTSTEAEVAGPLRALLGEEQEGLESDADERLQALVEDLSLRRESYLTLQHLLKEVAKEGTADRGLFPTLEGAKTIADLPAPLRRVVGLRYVAPSIAESVGEPKTRAKLGKLHGLAPVTPLKALFGISNPVKLTQELLVLFFAKPLGSRSLLQRQYEVAFEVKAGRQLLADARKRVASISVPQDTSIGNKAVDTIGSWVKECYDPSVGEVTPATLAGRYEIRYSRPNSGIIATGDTRDMRSMLKVALAHIPAAEGTAGSTQAEGVPENLARALVASADAREALSHLLRVELDMRAKEALIDLLGEDVKLLQPLKDIVAAFAGPISTVVGSASMSTVLDALSTATKALIIAGESISEARSEDAFYAGLDAVSDALGNFETALLGQVQRVLTMEPNSPGEMRSRDVVDQHVTWAARHLFCPGDHHSSATASQAATTVVDLRALLTPLEEDDAELVLAEIDAWIKFKRAERELKDGLSGEGEGSASLKSAHNLVPPLQEAIPRLLTVGFKAQIAPVFEAELEMVLAQH